MAIEVIEPDPAVPVANLMAVGGFGPRGAQVVQHLRELRLAMPREQQQCMLLWCPGESGPTWREAIETELLSQQSLDTIATHYQIPGRAIGQPLEVHVFCVVDLGDTQAATTVVNTFHDFAHMSFNVHRIACLLSPGHLADVQSAAIAGEVKWDALLPFPAREIAAGTRSDADLIETVARTLLVLSVPGADSLLHRIVRRSSAGEPHQQWIRASGAFLEARVDSAMEHLSRLIAGHLLREQFGNPRACTPAEAFDDQHRTTVEDLVAPERLAQELLANTPFVLDTRPGSPWQMRLSPRETALRLHDLPSSRWVAVLRKLRDFFDYTKARRWREALEEAMERVGAALATAMTQDIDALHRYMRAPDRVITWCTRVRDRLDAPIDITKPTTPDFDPTIANLHLALETRPNGLAVGVRLALLGGLAGAAANAFAGDSFGWMAGVVAATAAAAIALLSGVRMFQVAHARVMRACDRALQALSGHYEQQARSNLLQALDALRRSLLAQVETIRDQNLRLAESAMAAATTLVAIPPTGGGDGIVNVVNVVPPALENDLLESLSIQWPHLWSEAARTGALVPAQTGDALRRLPPEQSVIQFALTYLSSRQADLGLRHQLEFRSQQNPAYLEQALADLDQRSALLGAGANAQATWLAPHDLLAHTAAIRQARTPGASEQGIAMELLACVRIGKLPLGAGGQS